MLERYEGIYINRMCGAIKKACEFYVRRLQLIGLSVISRDLGGLVMLVMMMLHMLVVVFGHGGGGHEPADEDGTDDNEERFFAQHNVLRTRVKN